VTPSFAALGRWPRTFDAGPSSWWMAKAGIGWSTDSRPRPAGKDGGGIDSWPALEKRDLPGPGSGDRLGGAASAGRPAGNPHLARLPAAHPGDPGTDPRTRIAHVAA
jgi:hypothetical protein